MTTYQSAVVVWVCIAFGCVVCLVDEWLRAVWFSAISILSEEDQAQLKVSPYEQ
jgi:hypothetical protein